MRSILLLPFLILSGASAVAQGTGESDVTQSVLEAGISGNRADADLSLIHI